jgi:hypothetical protein
MNYIYKLLMCLANAKFNIVYTEDKHLPQATTINERRNNKLEHTWNIAKEESANGNYALEFNNNQLT